MNPLMPHIRRELRRTRSLLAMAALGLVLAGCAGRPAPLLPDLSPEAAMVAASSFPAAQAVTATARIEIIHQGSRYPLKAALMMKRPDFLRVESIPVMGPPDFYLSVSGGELRVFVPQKSAFYIGRDTAWNISRFFPIPMSASEMVSLLLGTPPTDGPPVQNIEMVREAGLFRIDRYRWGKKIRSLWIDSARGRLVRVRSFADDETVVYTADLEDYVAFGEGFLPRQVTIRAEGAAVMTVRLSDLRLIEFDPAAFPLPLPEGVAPIPLGS
jgi:hypothetical protein